MAEFSRYHSFWVKSDAEPLFSAKEVVRRARSRLGEDRYRLLTNNCEHFCEWCLHGQDRSYQVETWLPGFLARPKALSALVGDASLARAA